MRSKKEIKSSFDYFNNLYKLADAVYRIVLFNFGFDINTNQVKIACKLTKMTETDKANFLWLTEKYRIDVINCPYILLDHFKSVMLNTLDALIAAVVQANSIYPVNEYEVNKKRSYINDAMGFCEIMIQHIQMSEQFYEYDHEKLQYVTKIIIDEREQLKTWKKAATKVYDKIHQENINNSALDKIKQEEFINNYNKSICPIYTKDQKGNLYYTGKYHTGLYKSAI